MTGRTKFRSDAGWGRTDRASFVLLRLVFAPSRRAPAAIGSLRLDGLAPGPWRDATPDEIRTLRRL